jgi:transposase
VASNSDKPLSNREAVRQLAPTLLKMRERGFTSAALVELLQEQQIAIKGRDLSRYLREYTLPIAKPQVKPTEDKASSPSSVNRTNTDGH